MKNQNEIKGPRKVNKHAIIGKEKKTSLPSDVDVGRAFQGEFRYNTLRNIRQTLPQTTTGTHPTCPHGTHSHPICCLSKSARIAAASSSDKAIHKTLVCCPSPSALSQLYAPPLSRSPMATVPALPYPLSPSSFWPRSQLYTSPLSRSPMATVPALPYPLSPSPFWPRSQLYHTRCARPLFGHGPSFILLCCPGLRWPPYQLYHTRSHRCRPIGPTHTAQTPIPSCLHQARYIVLGCGSFVRGRKRKKADLRPFYIIRVNDIRAEPVETPLLDQYRRSSIPIIYILDPFST